MCSIEAVVRERQRGAHVRGRERDARNIEQRLDVGGVNLVPGSADAVYERPFAARDVEHAATTEL